MSTYQFLPWVRSGLTTLIKTPELGRKDLQAGTPGQVTLPATVKLNGTLVDMKKNGKPPRFYGPGDVIGIDTREIIRTAPLDLTPDYQPERFAFIEFDRPDFPWLFTPGVPDSHDCLRPWLVLVVVEKSQATITPSTAKSLPILSCPLKELPPNLNESWAWAHAVYAGDLGNSTVEAKLGDKTLADHNLSRLLCPRKLAAHIPYEACLVPAFETGRKAGLGLPFDVDNTPLAHWSFTTDADVKLPVYYHWSFSTGAENLFMKLANQLQALAPDAIPSDIAGDMDLSNPGNGMGNTTNQKIPIPSALRIKGTSEIEPTIDALFTARLLTLLTTPPDQQTPFPPPLYGSWHAPPGTTLEHPDNHNWLNALNLDPRYRVAAALGTSVIQKEQDHLIAVAWEQVGDLQRANELLQRKQLACCVTESVHKKRLGILSTSVFLQFAEPLPPPESTKPSASERGFRSLSTTHVNGNGIGADSSISRTDAPVRSAEQANEPLTSFAEQVLADRPVAYYRLNESSGSTTVLDSSGHNHHGTVSPHGVKLGIPSIGRPDLAAEFEGLNDGRVLVPSTSLLSPTQITIEAVVSWGGPTVGPKGPIQQRIAEKSFSSASPTWPTYALSVKSDGNVVLFELIIADPNVPGHFLEGKLHSTNTVPIGIPIHITGTYDGTTVCLYINGVLDRTQKVGGDLYVETNAPSDLAIGNHFGYPDAFKGLLDELAIYDRALSAERVRTHALTAFPQTQLERVATTPQFRRVTRPSGSWALKGNVTQYPLDQIAPPPGVTTGSGQISGYRSSQSVSTSKTLSGSAFAELRRKDLLDRTDPQKTFRQDVANRVHIPTASGLKAADASAERFHQHGPLGLYTYTPTFPQPMYEPLRDLFPHMLLPGLEKIPNDRVALLKPNAPFIEAYMVGLNHELSREFLWREFPTMVNVTYFSRFWDARSATNPKDPDFPPIGQWANNVLGTNLAPDRGGKLTFLLIRGELIVRYPNALIYARKKGSRSDVDLKVHVLRFSPIAGVALLGFNLDNTSTTQWTFYVEEHFTEPYLGPRQDAAVPPGSQYVSFANNEFLYKNGAAVAKESLQTRFYMELPVPPEAPQD